MFHSSRFTAAHFTRCLGVLAGSCVAVCGLLAAPALAEHSAKDGQSHTGKTGSVPPAMSAVAAVCPGQSFSQPFAALGDSNYYTEVPGSEFTSPAEGWQLRGGAHVVAGTRPDGSTGSVLDLPGGAVAVSPPVCVTLQYPTARVWTHSLDGKPRVSVAVGYASTNTLARATRLGSLEDDATGEGWSLSAPFEIQPQLGGRLEETRDVRFIFTAETGHADMQLFGLYVDPRMR